MPIRSAVAPLLRRIERTWAADAVAFAEVLAATDPSWGATTFPLAGGHAVLCGPGMYVNRAMAVAIDQSLTDADLDDFERRCRAVGVAPAIDVTPVSDPALADRLAARGYVDDGRVTMLALELDGSVDGAGGGSVRSGEVDPPFLVEPVRDDAGLAAWQATSATGWGHTDPDARRVSDAFTRAAWAVDGDRMIVARARVDGEPVGAASLTIRDGLATLGGMSTVPAARRRGVQATLVRYRLAAAARAGCDLAAATAVTAGDSERNLQRLGFAAIAVRVTWRLAGATA